MSRVRIAAAQLNIVVGDLDGNVARIIEAIRHAEGEGCDLIVFPELAITGYPPEDLLLKPSFVDDNLQALAAIAAEVRTTTAFVGYVDRGPRPVMPDVRPGLFNAAAVLHDKRVVGTYRKRRLPNYAVFDEQRYFDPGTEPLQLYEIAGRRVGMSICEDAWAAGGPVQQVADGGAELIVNLNASPYHRGKLTQREQMLCARSNEANCPIVYVNQVGGQDELVFDGASLVIDADGTVLTRGPQFVESVFVTDIEVPERPEDGATDRLPVVAVTLTAKDEPVTVAPSAKLLDPVEEVYEALVLGTRDYVRKNGFTDVVIGLSGGVDSSIVAVLAADALGAEHVHGVLMPSRYSSDHSVSDAEVLAQNLGIEYRTIAIEPAFAALSDMLAPSFEGLEFDLTEENMQARIRGVLLMALSNKFGWMVLTTSNKSESAVGFSTLYGDSAGGFGVIKDVPKLLVYDLCRWRNDKAAAEGGAAIPESVLTKPPSAELRPGQEDSQSLPSYDILDPIVAGYVEQDRSIAELIDEGFDPDVVRRVARLIDIAEYKRRQAPPGPRISTKAFGKDRRLPITNRYSG